MNDYIEREAAIKVLCDACVNIVCQKWLIPRCSYYEKMQAIPAADVRPVVRGWWVTVTNGHGWHECSLCHDYAPLFQSGEEHLTNYCPNCGADMRKKEET